MSSTPPADAATNDTSRGCAKRPRRRRRAFPSPEARGEWRRECWERPVCVGERERNPLHSVGTVANEGGDGLIEHALAHIAFVEPIHSDRVVFAQQHAEIGVIEETAQLVQREGGRVVQKTLQCVRRERIVVNREKMLQITASLLLRYRSFSIDFITRNAVEHAVALEVLEFVLQRERGFGTHHHDALGAERTQLLTERLLHRASFQQLCGTGGVISRNAVHQLLYTTIPIDCFDVHDDRLLERRVERMHLREDGVRVRIAVLLCVME